MAHSFKDEEAKTTERIFRRRPVQVQGGWSKVLTKERGEEREKRGEEEEETGKERSERDDG